MVSTWSCFCLIVVILSYFHTGSEALPVSRTSRKSTLARRVSQKFQLLPENEQPSGDVIDPKSSRSNRHGISMTHAGTTKSVTVGRLPRVHGDRQKRYVLIGEEWNKRELTYRVTQYSRHLPKAIVDATIDDACKMWEAVSPIKFTRVYHGTPDIELMFVEGHHGDAQAFDGEGGRLAHAEGPMYGDIHFDDDDIWTVGEDRGTNLLYIAVHELGHSLGLDHSDLKTAVMHYKYPGYKRGFTLHADDIEGIQQVYPEGTAGSGETELQDFLPKDNTIISTSDRASS